MSKRGQITIFVILGIVLLALSAGIFYLSKTFPQKEIQSQDLVINSPAIQSYVENCLEKSTIRGMQEVFAQGGYYQSSVNTRILEFVKEDKKYHVPYYFSQGKENLPSLSTIEEQTSQATQAYFIKCINDFTIFKSQGYEFKFNEPNISVTFTQKRTLVKLDYALTAGLGIQAYNWNNFRTTIPFDFATKYEDIKEYLNSQERKPSSFLMGELSFLSNRNNYLFGFSQFGEEGESVLVNLKFDEQLAEEPLIYNFALNYDWTLPPPSVDITPEAPTLQLNLMPVWNITTRGIHHYQVRARGKGLKFDINPSSLSINPDSGIISINSDRFSNEEYVYYIEVTDSFGERARGPLFININVNPGNLPIIEPPNTIIARIGEAINYTTNILNKNHGPFRFKSQSALFVINETTGEVYFTPTKADIGIHSNRIDASNSNGYTWLRWEIEVKQRKL